MFIFQGPSERFQSQQKAKHMHPNRSKNLFIKKESLIRFSRISVQSPLILDSYDVNIRFYHAIGFEKGNSENQSTMFKRVNIKF